MGKGDKRSRKGKINRGSYGNSRPKQRNIVKNVAPVAPKAEEPKATDEA